MSRIGVDVGGTFTDLVSIDDSGGLGVAKVLTTPGDESVGIAEAVRASQVPISSVEEIVHGTTTGTNAVLERRGARTVLVTTAGFRDILELQNQERTDIWDLAYEKAVPLVPRERCVELRERMSAPGSVLAQPDQPEIERVVSEVERAQAESVAICLLHSYRNDAHERRVESALSNVYTVASSRIAPQFREYDRASTTVMSAYIGPILARYLLRLEASLHSEGFEGELLVMQSNGGLAHTDVVSDKAIGAVLSGPAGGVVAAARAGRLSGVDDVISFDMGGTSTDVCLVSNGRPQVAARSLISGLPVISPMFRIDTVGAGGGSVAWVDQGGLLRVGPESAGSVPGPASYGRGGERPTVTDALVCLGILRGSRPFAGALQLDRTAAMRAMRTVADRIGESELVAAEAAVRVANHRMAESVRRVSLNQGYDPRDFTLVAFGGAGPLHAAWVAEEMGIDHVIVPLHAGVLSAIGVLSSDFRSDHVYSDALRLSDSSTQVVQERVSSLVERARRDAGRGADEAEPTVQLDLSYAGQAHWLAVDYALDDELGDLVTRFHEAHRRRYGFVQEDADVLLINVRIGLVRRRDRPTLSWNQNGSTEPFTGEIFVHGDPCDCVFTTRDEVTQAVSLAGPAVIEEETATTFVPAGWTASMDGDGQLHLRNERRGFEK
jgi:N-methylhydantoinase A